MAGWGRGIGRGLGVALIGLWVAWWVGNVLRDRMIGAEWTWVPPLTFLAGDFRVHIDHVARLAAAGTDVYRKADDWICAIYPYPPTVTRLFAWVALVEPTTAARVWLAVLACLFAGGGLAVRSCRRDLGLDAIPTPLVIAGVLFSTPALFAMERGQADPVVIAPWIAAAWLLRRRVGWTDLLAGGILGATAWLKYYPGLAVVALVTLGRWRAVAGFVAVAGAIGLADLDGVRLAISHARGAEGLLADKVRFIHPTKHSLVESWSSIGFVHRSKILRAIPGPVAAAILLVPALLFVGRGMRARAVESGPLILPYLFWLTALATFGMPYANDYNLVTLPLAALAVWSRRDAWPIQAGMGLMLVVWWQPIALPFSGQTLLFVKLFGLYAVGGCLVARQRGLDAAGTLAVSECRAPGS